MTSSRRLPVSTAALIGVALLCAAAPQQKNGIGNEGTPRSEHAPTPPGPRGPQPAGATDPVPPDAPEGTVRNVPATTGHANLRKTPAPFAVAPIGRFDKPFAMAWLPGGDLLVTEKDGRLMLRLASGRAFPTGGVPPVAKGGQGGLLGVAAAPDYPRSHAIYLAYSEPAPEGSQLALARARFVSAGDRADPQLRQFQVIWRSGSYGPGGQFGAKITFSPDGRYLFLTSGERQRFTPAQDSEQLLGKIVRLTLDGRAAPGNPYAGRGPTPAMIWSIGHRNPYGILFTPDGRLWEEEMGPRGGDELNLIEPGKNYGWPLVSNGDNYSGQPIPDHPSRPDLAAPALWWNPSVSPGGMIYYTGTMFPQLRGSLLIGTMSQPGLFRVKLDGARATPAEFWATDVRTRDVTQAPDGSIWLLEDGASSVGGRLLRLTPKG